MITMHHRQHLPAAPYHSKINPRNSREDKMEEKKTYEELEEHPGT